MIVLFTFAEHRRKREAVTTRLPKLSGGCDEGIRAKNKGPHPLQPTDMDAFWDRDMYQHRVVSSFPRWNQPPEPGRHKGHPEGSPVTGTGFWCRGTGEKPHHLASLAQALFS